MTRKGVGTTVAAAVLAALPWVGIVQAQEPPGPPPGREFGPGAPGGPGGPGFGPRMAEELGLSDDQKAQLEALRAKQRETLRPLMESARQAHEAFQTALDADRPDATAIGQAALVMKAAEKKLRAAHDAAFEEMKAILTPEQAAKLEQARAQRKGPGPGGFGRRGPRP
jgi:Spy/CpxP family protein refolding chaperone